MTNFTKRQQAEAEINVGKGKLATARHGRGAMGFKMSNKARLDLTKSGTKDLLSGTIASNRLPRPPAKKKRVQVARKK